MRVLSVLLFVGIISRINSQCLIANDNSTEGNKNSKALLIEAELNFALDTLNQSLTFEGKENIFYSPHSIHEALMLAYFGARGDTETNLKRALKIPEELGKIDVQRSYALDKSIKQFSDTVVSSKIIFYISIN